MATDRRMRGATKSSTLLERLKRRGWRLTAQRRVIAEAMGGAHVHLTADEVFARASDRLPEISRATVYNTLNELAKLGEITEVALGSGAKRYDPETVNRHQHLVCEGCGITRDVHPDGESRLALPVAERDRFTLNRVEIAFWGLCPKCVGAART